MLLPAAEALKARVETNGFADDLEIAIVLLDTPMGMENGGEDFVTNVELHLVQVILTQYEAGIRPLDLTKTENLLNGLKSDFPRISSGSLLYRESLIAYYHVKFKMFRRQDDYDGALDAIQTAYSIVKDGSLTRSPSFVRNLLRMAILIGPLNSPHRNTVSLYVAEDIARETLSRGDLSRVANSVPQRGVFAFPRLDTRRKIWRHR